MDKTTQDACFRQWFLRYAEILACFGAQVKTTR